MTDEISESKTRYERLDPNVIQVLRLAELADKDTVCAGGGGETEGVFRFWTRSTDSSPPAMSRGERRPPPSMGDGQQAAGYDSSGLSNAQG
jgi:hypothetical protein